MRATGFPARPGDIIDGDGWMLDWPAVPHRYSVRTCREAPVTYYYVGGIYTNPMGKANVFPFEYWMWPALPPTVLAPHGSIKPGRSYVDLEHIEFVNVPYPGAAFPSDISAQTGIDYACQLIRNRPGKFVLGGISQGGAVLGGIYDELRYGSLQDRRPDLIGAVTWGSLRKEQGHSFTDAKYGKWPDPAPTRSGMWLPNIKDTEQFWQDMYDADDIVSCCENDPNAENYKRDKWIRLLFDVTRRDPKAAAKLLASGPAGWQAAYNAYLAITDGIFTADPAKMSPHHRLWTTKPFEDKGDDRTNAEVMLDYVNSFGTTPITAQPKVFRGKNRPMTPGAGLAFGADVFWVNVKDPGEAISVGLECYDAKTQLITTLKGPNSAVANPDRYQFDPVTLQGNLFTPPGTASVNLACSVSGEAMKTGIVWFSNPVYERRRP